MVGFFVMYTLAVGLGGGIVGLLMGGAVGGRTYRGGVGPFNKLLKLKNAQEYCKLVGHHFFSSLLFFFYFPFSFFFVFTFYFYFYLVAAGVF